LQNFGDYDHKVKVTLEEISYLFEESFKPVKVSLKASQTTISHNNSSSLVTLPILCLKDTEFYAAECLCLRQDSSKTVECEICKGKRRVTHVEIYNMMTQMLRPKSEEFDQEWTLNAYQHVIWKLNAYQEILNLETVNLENIIYNVGKRYRKEFIRGKKSFFQRIVQKDEAANSQFVSVVAGVNRLNNHTELVISDGYYCLKSILRRSNENDEKILSLINDQQKIYPGMKLSMINQSLVPLLAETSVVAAESA
jgi:hypothetical protein